MKSPKLNENEFFEMSEYRREELLRMFELAIEEMALKGIISSQQRIEYLNNIDKWLLELMEN